MNDYNILKITGKRQLKALFYFICGLILYIGIFIYFKIDDRFFIMIVVDIPAILTIHFGDIDHPLGCVSLNTMA